MRVCVCSVCVSLSVCLSVIEYVCKWVRVCMYAHACVSVCQSVCACYHLRYTDNLLLKDFYNLIISVMLC